MSEEAAARPDPVRPPRFGLSGKLLVLTILFVMIAEVLIYVPSVANYRVMWLKDRLASGYTAALVLDAAPNGVVLRRARQADPQLDRRPRRRHEDGHAAPASRRRRHAAADQRRFRHARCQILRCIVDAFEMLLNNHTRGNVMRVVGPAPMGGDYIELIMDEPPLREAMLRYSADILLISLLISGITAALVYLALHYCSCGRCAASPPT